MIAPFGQLSLSPSGDTSGAKDLANLEGAFNALAANARLPSGAVVYYATGKITLQPGTFYFTASAGNILGSGTRKISGIWLEGSGRGVTYIDYNPTTSAPFLIDTLGLDVKMSDCECLISNAVLLTESTA